jgi:hypothetical protein
VRTLQNPLRAPAEIPQTGYVSAIKRLLMRVADCLIFCRHKTVTLPYNNRQTCLDCGATRRYLYHSDFEHADAGITVGKWRKAVPAQNAHRMVAKRLIENAMPDAQRREPRTPRFDRLVDSSFAIADKHLAAQKAVKE